MYSRTGSDCLFYKLSCIVLTFDAFGSSMSLVSSHTSRLECEEFYKISLVHTPKTVKVGGVSGEIEKLTKGEI